MSSDEAAARARARRAVWLAFGAVLVVYVVAVVLLGRMPFADEIAFKAAGREWAQTGRFAAPELWGFRKLQPPVEDVWFAHLPVYTFLYGLFVTVAGFGPRSAIVFDAAIHALLAAATAVTACTLAPSLSARTAALAGLAVLPLGILGRPDELAVLLALLGVRHMHAAPLTVPRAAAAGALFGACGATSLGVAFQLGLVGAPHMLLAAGGRVVPRGLAWVGTGAVVFAILVAPFLVARPDALAQYSQHAATQFGHTMLASYVFSWTFGRAFVCIALGSLACAAVAFERSAHWVRVWLGPTLATLNLMIFFGFKFPYAWFVGPWVIAALAADAGRLWTSRARRVGIVVVAVFWLGGASRTVHDWLIHLSLSPAQRFDAAADRVRTLIPPGSRVLAFEHWPALASDRAVFDPLFAEVDIATIDYVIQSGNGAGEPGRAVPVRADRRDYVAAHFVPVDDFLNREPNRILGVRIARSGYGYGALVLKRVR